MRDKSFFRVLDVNLNRAREGIRVIEDTARFIWHDSSLYHNLRSLRHRLDRTVKKLYGSLITSRNSAHDVGRRAEAKRFNSCDSIVRANLRRAQESLRVLEEYSRFINISLTSQFQKIRFRLYQLEKKVFQSILKRGRKSK